MVMGNCDEEEQEVHEGMMRTEQGERGDTDAEGSIGTFIKKLKLQNKKQVM